MSTKVTIVPPLYKRILSRFPQNFTFCFAYGSGVKKQLQNKPSENMIDLIFCVNNPDSWHEANLKNNSSHYSGLRHFGHHFVARYQENFGAKVYFNTLVPLDDFYIKYGVVSTNDLITDLLEWSDLYLAGRLHKPVEIIKKPLSSELETALQLNLQSAVHAALLILPETFTEYEFYCTISNLSYSGDFRMTFGENKNKVSNIVKPQLIGFRSLYRSFISTLQDYVEFPIPEIKPNKNEIVQITKIYNPNEIPLCCSQDISPLARLYHLNQLPRWPQKSLTRFWNRGTLRQDTEDVLRAIAYDPDCVQIVKRCISDIVWKSSVSQSLKGILTAGDFIMYQTSDSDSADSDRGIRYKTDSIRNKSRNSGSSSRRERSPKKFSRNERKSPNKEKYRENRKRESSHGGRDRDKRKYREREKVERDSRKINRDRSSFMDVEVVSQSPTPSDQTSQKNNQKQEKEVKYLGPALPPHLQKKIEEESQKKYENIQSEDKTSDSCLLLQAGLILPGEKANKPAFTSACPEESNSPTIGPDISSKESREAIECPKEDILGPTLLPSIPNQLTDCNSSEINCNSTNKVIGPVLPILPPNVDEDLAQDPPDSREKIKTIGPVLPDHLKSKEKDEQLLCGPSLPPAMLNQSLGTCIGPTIPPHLRDKLIQEADTQPEEEDVYGPVPVGASFSKSHMELEERALEMKIAQLDPKDKKEPTREEWMLELPEVKAANLGLGPRQFRAKAGPDLSDRSSWTDNPQDKAKKNKGKEEPKIDLQRETELKEMKRRDKEQEAIAKKNKRSKESLVDIHTKKLKAGKDEAGPQERRPFSRDTDLQVNRFDEAQKKAVLKKAQLLDTRFSSGESKFL